MCAIARIGTAHTFPDRKRGGNVGERVFRKTLESGLYPPRPLPAYAESANLSNVYNFTSLFTTEFTTLFTSGFTALFTTEFTSGFTSGFTALFTNSAYKWVYNSPPYHSLWLTSRG